MTNEPTNDDASQGTAKPTSVVVGQDFDGYFEEIVRSSLRKAACPYDVIHVRATPYLADACQFRVTNAGRELHLTFYSGLRRGFGQVNWATVDDVIAGRTQVMAGA